MAHRPSRTRTPAGAAHVAGFEDLARALELAHDAVIGASLDGRITSWNRGAEEIYGYSAAEAIGQPVSMLAPDDRRGEPESLLRLAAGGDVVERLQTVRRRKDGRPIECFISITPVRDGQRVTGVVAIMHDVTQLNQAERALRERDAQFRAVLDQNLAGIYILSEAGRVVYVNTGFAHVCGYTPDEVIGHPFVEFVADGDREAAATAFRGTLTGRLTEVESRIRTSDGRLRDVLSYSTRGQFEGQPAVIGVVVDITDRKRSERSLERVNRLLRTMTGVNEALIHSSSGSELMQRMCDVIVSVGHYDGASIALWSAGQLELASMAGAYPTRAAHAEAMGQSPISGAPRVSGTCAFFPLLRQSAAIGSLGIRTGYQESFDGDEMALLTDMAGDLSYGISVLLDRTEHEAFSERLRRSMEDTIAALAAMAEMRDAYTAGHQRHVAELAAAIAREMGLDESRVRAIHLAAVVHDIGKIKIPAELLTKPVRLTPIETQLMRTHVEAGYDILKGIDFPWPIADIVRQHHERIDGSGYPHGLTGDQLHLEAKILAVADVVDATAAHRPYRFGKGIESALADLQAASGILYDSASVDACVAVFQKGFTFSPPRAPEPDPL